MQCYNGYIVNGYRFHTKDYGINKSTINSGVCVKGSSYGENEHDYYGVIEEIMELTYLGMNNRVTIFKCHWFDPTATRLDKASGIVEVNHKSRFGTYEPFILASQAQQVYYTSYPSIKKSDRNEWWAVCKVKSKLYPEYDQLQEDELAEDSDYYQSDDVYDFAYGHDVAHDMHVISPLADETFIEECDPNDVPSGWANNEEEEEEEEEEESQTSDEEEFSS